MVTYDRDGPVAVIGIDRPDAKHAIDNETALDRVALGVAFGFGLWVLAAGVVMPAWLRLVGVGAPLPNLPPGSLAAHALWGLTAATVYHVGDRWLAGRDDLLSTLGLDLR